MKTMKEIYDDIYITEETIIRTSDGKLKAWTDKNTRHCYVDQIYEGLFKDIRHTAKKILEIGTYVGGSVLAWQEYFPNATIYGVDTRSIVQELNDQKRIIQISGNAYSDDVVNKLDNDFDVVIDDGPHSLDSFKLFIKKYFSKLKLGGFLVIEDIPNIDYEQELINSFPQEYREKVKLYDLRHVKNIYDDIMLIIKK